MPTNRFTDVLTYDVLHEHYVAKQMGTAQIGELFGCSDMCVAKYLRRVGIPIRKQGKPPLELANKRFGKLIAIRDLGRNSENDRSHRWLCKCDCGRIVEIPSSILKNGFTRSCGCLLERRQKECPKWKGILYIPFHYFNRVKEAAGSRDIDFLVSLQYVENVLIEQEFCCKLSGLPIQFGESARHHSTASLDRIDNTLGYVEGNVQWVHKDLNRMKWTHTSEYFVSLCRSVAEYQPKLALQSA